MFKRTWSSGMRHGVIWCIGTHVSKNLLPTSLGQILLPKRGQGICKVHGVTAQRTVSFDIDRRYNISYNAITMTTSV
jgi:hypothetical protein